MSDAHRSQNLVLPLSPQEMEAILRAAGADGFATEDVVVWARQLIVETALLRIANSELRHPSAEVPPPAIEPKPSLGLGPCRCGYTSNPAGQCDGSCIMRY